MENEAPRVHPLDPTVLAARIEQTYDELENNLQMMQQASATIDAHAENAKVEHSEEYLALKNAEAREVKLAEWLDDDPEYRSARKTYNAASRRYQLADLRAKRLSLLVRLATGANQ